jgi:hypothetical protein
MSLLVKINVTINKDFKRRSILLKNKFFAILGTIVLTSSILGSNASAQTTFKDVNNYWAGEQINYLAEKNIIGGYPDGTFKPNNQLTRAQAAKMLVKALKLPTTDRPAPQFKDIKKGHQAFTAIATIADEGLMGGTNGLFRPDETLSRAQMAAILTKSFELKEGSTYKFFKDVSKKHWAYEKIHLVASNRITGGYSDGTYRPSQPTTRAQFSVFLAVALYPELFQPNDPDKVTREANKGVTYYGSWVYYNGYEIEKGGNGLFRKKIDGSQKERLFDGSSGFEIENDKFYYDCDGGLCQMDLNGENKKKIELPETNLYLLEVEGKWLYLIKTSNPNKNFPTGLYRMNLETKETTLLSKGKISSYVVTEKGIYLYGPYDDNEFYPITGTKAETVNLWDVTSITDEITDTDKKNYVYEIDKVFADRGDLYYTVSTRNGIYRPNQKFSYYFIKYNEATKKMSLLRDDVINPFNIYDGYVYMDKYSKIYRTSLSGGSLEYVADIPEYSYVTCSGYSYVNRAGFSIIGGEIYFYEKPEGHINDCDDY